MIVAALIGVALGVIAWIAPRLFIGVGLLLVVASVVLRLALPEAAVNLLDELVVGVGLIVLVARRLWRRQAPVLPSWVLWFAAFLAAGLLSSLVNSVPTSIALEGAVLAMKAVLFGVMAAQVDWRPDDLKPFAVGGAITIVVLFCLCVANLIAGQSWVLLIVGRDAYFEGIGPIPALIGPFEHPAALGRFAALLAVAVIAYRLFVDRGWKSAVLLGMASLTALSSLRVKTIVSLVVATGFIGAVNVRRLSRALVISAITVAAIAAVPVGIYVAIDIQQYLLSTSARSLMTVGALEVAAREFPLGAGFGRYGSYTAAIHYSPEYLPLGFPGYYGLEPRPGGQFLTDTSWPAILGEAGWLGLVFFALGIAHIAYDLWRSRSVDNSPLVQWASWTAIGWLLVILVESIGAPVFTSAPSYALPFVAAGIVHGLSRGRNALLTQP